MRAQLTGPSAHCACRRSSGWCVCGGCRWRTTTSRAFRPPSGTSPSSPSSTSRTMVRHPDPDHHAPAMTPFVSCPLFSFVLSALTSMLRHWHTWTRVRTLYSYISHCNAAFSCITPRAARLNLFYFFLYLCGPFCGGDFMTLLT